MLRSGSPHLSLTLTSAPAYYEELHNLEFALSNRLMEERVTASSLCYMSASAADELPDPLDVTSMLLHCI